MEKFITLDIEGMHCVSCAQIIKKRLSGKVGVVSVDINHNLNTADITYLSSDISASEIISEIKASGYGAKRRGVEKRTNQDSHDLRNLVIASALLSPIFIRMVWPWQIGIDFQGIDLSHFIAIVLAGIIVLYYGRHFHLNAIRQAVERQAGMDSLVSLSTLCAFFYSIWAIWNKQAAFLDSAATITVLVMLGRFMESRSRSKASSAIDQLLELSEGMIRIIKSNGEESQKKAKDVEIGEIFEVRPGDKILADGLIEMGESDINESTLSGESLPVSKRKGAKVFAGTINLSGILRVKVMKSQDQSLLSQIIKSLEKAQIFRSPVQKLADRISAVFVPAIIVISLLIFLLAMLGGYGIEESLLRMLSILIIACPCALGIATPMATMISMAAAAGRGILIKDGESFEKAKLIQEMVFDKTGTLSTGKPRVEKFHLITESKRALFQPLAVAISLKSSHPLAKALVESSRSENSDLPSLTKIIEIPGQGIKADSQYGPLALGNIRLLKTMGIDTHPAELSLQTAKELGETMNFLVLGKEIIGTISYSDQAKPSAKESIARLSEIGISTAIISGDNHGSVQKLAKELSIDNYYSEILPQDKAEILRDLQKDKRVAYVGDGINDAPSLAQADLGIAIGSGADIAKEAGDIVIIGSDIKKAVEALELSRYTYHIIKQNLFWAFCYNIIALPLAASGNISPSLAALAMSLSSLSVTLNSLRIKRYFGRIIRT